MFDDEQFVHNQHPMFNAPIERKISRQKATSEHRSDHQLNGNHIFESPSARIPHSRSFEFDSSLRNSAGARSLHDENDVILTNGYDHQTFHPPQSRKVTKITPKENQSISNSRPIPPRSSSASSALTTKHENKDSALTPSDIQRLKNVRRHEPAHVPSGPESKKSLITPDSWKSYPVVLKPRANKKPPPTVVTKPTRREKTPDPVVKQPSPVPEKPKPEKPKQIRSAIKPKQTEPPPAPKIPKKEKTKEEIEKIRQYMLEKRQEHEQNLTHEKQLKQVQERERKDKLKKLNEQIKKVAQQPLSTELTKKLTSTPLQNRDQGEQTRERLLQLLGPREISEPPSIYHPNTPFEQAPSRERSPSPASSTSSESIVEIQPPKIEPVLIHPPSQQSIPTGAEQRQQNLLRWALNLTRDCNHIEDKLKYLRPDGTQPFDLIPASRPNPQHDDGNLRSQTPIVIKNNTKPEPIIPSKVLRPSGRLIKLNKNRTNEYQGQDLPGVGNLRDPVLEQRIKRDRAAAKIQAAYRGYSVRKSIHWLNDRKQRMNDRSNKRPVRKPTKPSSHPMDLFDTPALNLDMRLSDDNFTIGSTLLRNFQRNGTKIIPSTPAVQPQQEIIRPKSTPQQTYSDDYENMTSTRTSTPRQQKQKPEKSRPVQQQQPIPEKSRPIQLPAPEKPRVIQQPALRTASTSSRTSSTSSSPSSSSSTPVSSSVTPTPTPEPPNVPRRRSISPPLPAQISSNNGRLIHPPSSFSTMTTTARRKSDERRYSPDALERQLNAELHLLDGVEASMKQVDNMERLRSVALAQQEVVSLAQILKNKPAAETSSEQTTRKPVRQVSSSPTTTTSSSSPTEKQRVRSRPRQSESTSSSSETILTAREKRARQKFHSETELQAYEKRLKDVEQKIRSLDKRAADVFTEKRIVASPRNSERLNSESSISEDLPVSHKSISSKSPAIERKNSNGISEIRTETYSSSFEKETDSSQKHQSVNNVTTDGSDIERRIRTYQDQIQKKKSELDHLKQRKNKDSLRRQEDELKKQLESYNHQIETLRTQPTTASVRKSPLKKSSSSSSSSSSSTPTKPPESSIAEELPASTTASQSKTNNIIKKKERDFFDDDDDDQEEEEKKKPTVVKPLETPRDERDTQHDAQSLSIATDIGASSETENDASRRPSTDIDKPILNLNTNLPSSSKPKDESDLSSSSSTTTTTSKKSTKIQTFERKPSPIVGDYDEDFSDVSHSPGTPTKQAVLPKSKIDDIDVESIQEDLEEKPSLHDTNQSLSSKSSGDEQSEILVLVKKSASNTPRRQEDKTFEEEFPPPPPPVVLPSVQPTTEVNYNDDTSHDVSEEEEEEQEQVNEKENKIDQLTDSFLRAFIDDAIDQGQKLKSLKKDNAEQKISLTQEAKEWVLDDDSPDDDEPRANEPETNELEIDLSGLGEKNVDEPRVESPRKIVVEEPIKPFIPHTREQVIHVCDEALKILLDQNNNFSDRSAIRCRIPPSFFTTEIQDADKEDIRQNHHAYCQMIFDLCVEILHEIDSENIQAPQYPEWQKAKLVSKRFFRGIKPHNRREVEQIVRNKILELLNVNARPVNYSKWRIFNNRRPGIEKFESVLDDEIRRSEPEWINYDTDSTQLKFDIADVILDQLIQETLTECLAVVNQRFYLSSNSTRL